MNDNAKLCYFNTFERNEYGKISKNPVKVLTNLIKKVISV